MDSTPPATTSSSQPEAIFCAAIFTASSPETVQLYAGHRFVPIGVLHDHLGDVGTLLADGRDAAHYHVVHIGRIQVVTSLELSQQAGPEVDGLYLVQRSAGLALAAGRAYGVIYVGGVWHGPDTSEFGIVRRG